MTTTVAAPPSGAVAGRAPWLPEAPGLPGPEPWQIPRAQTPSPLPGVEAAALDAPFTADAASLLASFRAGFRVGALFADLEARSAAEPRAGAAILSLLPVAAAVAEAEARYAAGAPRPLEGLPFGVKAIIDVAGAPVTCGSLTTGARVAEADATVVARLRAAGAIPYAMLATTEFAAGSPFNPRHGVVTNPWDPARWTGGSSTGSGAALARRLLPLALGTDTGGSVRVPSCWCGVTGLKPTRGLVPTEGVATLSWTLDHVGPMARSARDLALALAVMAGPDPRPGAPASVRLGTGAPPALRDLRVGVAGGWFTDCVDGAVLAAFEAAQTALAAAGARLVAFPMAALGDLAEAHDLAWDVLTAELAATQAVNAPHRGVQDQGLVARIARGEAVTAKRYLQAMQARAVLTRRLFEAMEGVELLLTPGLGAEAGTLAPMAMSVNGAALGFDAISRNTMIFDYTGFPALMLPAGFGPNGLPLGVQIVARPWQDGLCLHLGMAFQALTDHHGAAP